MKYSISNLIDGVWVETNKVEGKSRRDVIKWFRETNAVADRPAKEGTFKVALAIE